MKPPCSLKSGFLSSEKEGFLMRKGWIWFALIFVLFLNCGCSIKSPLWINGMTPEQLREHDEALIKRLKEQQYNSGGGATGTWATAPPKEEKKPESPKKNPEPVTLDTTPLLPKKRCITVSQGEIPE